MGQSDCPEAAPVPPEVVPEAPPLPPELPPAPPELASEPPALSELDELSLPPEPPDVMLLAVAPELADVLPDPPPVALVLSLALELLVPLVLVAPVVLSSDAPSSDAPFEPTGSLMPSDLVEPHPALTAIGTTTTPDHPKTERHHMTCLHSTMCAD